MVASMVRRSDERLRFIAPIEARVASIATVPPRRRKAAMRQQQRIPKTLPFYRRLLNERRRMEAARSLVTPSNAVAGQASASGAAVPSETAASASVASETPSERPTDEVKRRKLTFTAPPPPPPILPTSAPVSDAPRTQFVYKTVTKVDRYGNKRQQLVRMPSN